MLDQRNTVSTAIKAAKNQSFRRQDIQFFDYDLLKTIVRYKRQPHFLIVCQHRLKQANLLNNLFKDIAGKIVPKIL